MGIKKKLSVPPRIMAKCYMGECKVTQSSTGGKNCEANFLIQLSKTNIGRENMCCLIIQDYGLFLVNVVLCPRCHKDPHSIKAKQKTRCWGYAPKRDTKTNHVQLKSRISRQ